MEDVESILCGPNVEELPVDPCHARRLSEEAQRHQAEFLKMVYDIMRLKKKDERHRQNGG